MSGQTLFSQQRRGRIVELVGERKTVTVHELCKLLDVSPATVRGDLRDLDREGLLVRTHGGAIERNRTGFERIFSQRRAEHTEAKRAIARAAEHQVADGDTILLDTGTTTVELARRLTHRRHLTIVTNDLEIARVLESSGSVEAVQMGGIVRRGYHCTVGPGSLHGVQGLRVDTAFMATNSLSLESGATTPDLAQAETKRAMIAIARKVVLLCDSSKIGRESFARFADLEQIDVLITEQLPDATRDALEEQGIEVIVAPLK